MKRDPFASLEAFYEECCTAPVPEGIVAKPSPRWWEGFAVPAGGLAFGAFVAAALVLSPPESSPEAGLEAARAIAGRQLEANLPPPRPKTRAIRERSFRWDA